MVGERRGVRKSNNERQKTSRILRFEREYFTHIHDQSTLERDRVFPYHLQAILAKTTKAKKILDVGCGLGYFLSLCDKRNLKTYGIDVSEYAVRTARKKTKASLFAVDASSQRWPYRSYIFDVVTAFDVLEHVYDSYFLLQEAYRVLKPGGFFYATTKNNQGRLGKLVDCFFPDDPTHINKKSANEWRKELKKVGFRNILVKGIVFYGFPPIASLRIKLDKFKIPVVIRPIFSPITYFAGVLVILAEK